MVRRLENFLHLRFHRFAIGLFVLSLFPVIAQEKKKPLALDIQNLMTVAEFRQAGLTKLSAEEIDSLSAWLSRFALKIYSSASPGVKEVTPVSPSAAAIETQMDGDFEGWSGETIFKLSNGQIWQQSTYAYTYHYAYRPKVLIYKSGVGYKMKVDGVNDTIEVKRLK